MRLRPWLAALVAVSSVWLEAFAQDHENFVDPETGIVFSQYSADLEAHGAPKGGFQLGVAFPQYLDKNEYLGHIVGSRPQGKGWASISHSAAMTDALLLLVWANGKEIMTSFRYATNYTQPFVYVGPLSFSKLASTVNKTHFTLTYRCQGCFSWSYAGKSGNQSLNGETVKFGWGQGLHLPPNPNDPNSPIDYHDNGFGVVAAIPSLAANPSYDTWASKNQPPRVGPPKQATLDPKWAGNRTAWPTLTKHTDGTRHPVVTFGGSLTKPNPALGTPTSLVAVTTLSPIASSLATASLESAPLSLSSLSTGSPTINQSGSIANPLPAQGASMVAPGAPMIITVTRPQPPFESPTAASKPAPKPAGGKGGGEDEEGWADIRTVAVRFFNTAPIIPANVISTLMLEARQAQTQPTSSSPQIPTPQDDLGAFPKMSGVPNKPPGAPLVSSGHYVPPTTISSARRRMEPSTLPQILSPRSIALASTPSGGPVPEYVRRGTRSPRREV